MKRLSTPFSLLLITLLTVMAGCAGGMRMTESGIPVARTPDQLGTAIDNILTEAGMDPAWWGIHVVRVDDGRVEYSRESDRSFMPASNTKLYTTAAGLALLGPEFRYETGLYRDGPIVNGVLEGNLIVRGSGDPAIGGRFTDGDRTLTFRNWADALEAAGVDTVRGDIIGDDNLFDDVPLGFGWSWDDEPYWYSAELSALSFNDNTVDIALEGRKGTHRLDVQDPVLYRIHIVRPVKITGSLVFIDSIQLVKDFTKGFSRLNA